MHNLLVIKPVGRSGQQLSPDRPTGFDFPDSPAINQDCCYGNFRDPLCQPDVL
ncbi:MAG: hypothetical protein GDA48_09200 [Hormoscilla sp. GM102CHS1]|nr:hypothetical protein [Hormoscilla sp. GM102CHS1]